MKKAIVNLTINVPDDFDTGSCERCPFCIKSSYESFPGCYSESKSCGLKSNPTTCPIEPFDKSFERSVEEYKNKEKRDL